MSNSTLFLETASPKPFIAFFHNLEIVQLVRLEPGPSLSRNLLPTIYAKLKENDQTVSSLSRVAIGIGPGSYTGIRVGAMIAKTLSFAKRLPIIPFNSLEVYCPDFNGPFISALNARSAGIYTQMGVKKEESLFFETPKLLSLDECKKLFQQYPIISPDISAIINRLPEIQTKWIDKEPSTLHLQQILTSSPALYSHEELHLEYLGTPP